MENNLKYRMFRDFFSIFDEENKEIAKIFLKNYKYKAVYYFDDKGETEEKEFDNFSSAFNFIKEINKK